jgi:predicted TIM-barrel fold metal-dependent hydrolase
LQVFPQQLSGAAQLAGDNPGIRIILDHAGMPIGRDPDSVREWRNGMAELARRPNVATKISALGTNDHAWTITSIRPFVLDTIEIFGPDRCMFGSNFPVDSLYSSLVKLYATFDELTADLSASDRRALFAETARRVYRFNEADTFK